MLDIRKRIFLIAGIGLLLLLLLLAFLIRKQNKVPTTTSPTATESFAPSGTNEQVPVTIIRDVPPPPPSSPEERQRLYVVQLSKIFVERYLSYSNQDLENGHVTDVATLATERMISYIQTQTEEYSRDYKGVSTKVISSGLEKFEQSTATVTIGIQQLLEEKGKSPTTAYKNGKVSLVQEGGVWKVDGLFFDEKE